MNTQIQAPGPEKKIIDVDFKKLKGVATYTKWKKTNLSFLAKPNRPEQTNKGRVIQIKTNFDFRYGTDFMLDEIRKMHVNLKDLQSGNYIVFINGIQSRLRMLTVDRFGDPVIAVKSMPRGRFLDLRVIQYLPEAFNGKSIDIDQATELAMNAFLGQTKRRNQNLLLEEQK